MPFTRSSYARNEFRNDVAPLGEGSFGQVYKAWSHLWTRWIAVKEIKLDRSTGQSDKIRRRFLCEIEIMAQLYRLGCPQIVGFYGYHLDQRQNELYLCLELVPGGTLAEALKGRKTLPVAEAAVVARDIARAIRVHSEEGVVHRDIKPSNVLLLKNGAGGIVGAKLTDYGLAQVPAVSSVSRYAGELPPGTSDYMSPEQERYQGWLTVHSDLYNLGVLIWEMLTGLHHATYRYQPIDTRLERMAEKAGSPELAGIVKRALEEEPRNRYGDPRALINDLDHLLEGLTVPRGDSAQTGTPPRIAPPPVDIPQMAEILEPPRRSAPAPLRGLIEHKMPTAVLLLLSLFGLVLLGTSVVGAPLPPAGPTAVASASGSGPTDQGASSGGQGSIGASPTAVPAAVPRSTAAPAPASATPTVVVPPPTATPPPPTSTAVIVAAPTATPITPTPTPRPPPTPTFTRSPPTPVPTTAVPATPTTALEAAPQPVAPPSGSSGDGATLEWRWVRALAADEEFAVSIEPAAGTAGRYFATTRGHLFTVPSDVLNPGSTIAWAVYVRRIQTEIRVSAVSPAWTVSRPHPGPGGSAPVR
jgi:serine/threonine protein kinase